jgi:hypothetical protein
MLGSLQVPTQAIEEGLIEASAGSLYRQLFPEPILERPYLGQDYQLVSVQLSLTHTVRLKQPQPETFPTNLEAQLEMLRGIPPAGELVGIFPLSFQMRLVPGSEGREYVGETGVYQNLNNPIDYSLGQTIFFAVSGVVPGAIGGPPHKTPAEEREEAQQRREEEALAAQAAILNQLLELESQAGAIGAANLEELEAILARLFELT